MSDNYNPDGPIIVWSDYGFDGWKPRSYPTIAAAISDGISHGAVITRRIKVEEFVNEEAGKP